jgi:hypothetical protein
MAKQFPRAGKPKAGGTKVTSCRSFSRRTSALTNAALINSLERLKKSGVEFYTSSFGKLRALIAGQNRFARRKNLSNTSETRLPSKWRNTRKTGPLVTTNHLLLQHLPRTIGALLPIWRPISKFLRAKRIETIERGAGGVSRNALAESPVSISSHGILSLMGSPAPFLLLSKKRASKPLRFRAVPAGTFT